MSLPKATEEPHYTYSSFRVKGKIFATLPPEGTQLHIFVDEDVRNPVIAAQPDVFEPLQWGAKVFGVKVTLARADPETVNPLLLQAWIHKAPKWLAARRARLSQNDERA